MRDLINEYLADKKSGWAETTFNSERSRLKSLSQYLDQSPAQVHLMLINDGHKPYAIKTAFIRICSLEAWAVENQKISKTPFKSYMDKQRNRFKHAYVKEDLDVTFEEALQRIQKLESPHREMAMSLLQTGVRISEAYKVNNGRVIGKGGKPRTIYGKIKATAPRSSFSRHLSRVGLKPHSLRKLWATRLGEKGATPADLCKAAGWSSISTAYAYLQARDDKRMQALVDDAIKE